MLSLGAQHKIFSSTDTQLFHTIISHLKPLLARQPRLYLPDMLTEYLCCLCNATLPSMDKSNSHCLSCITLLPVCVQTTPPPPPARACLSSGGHSSLLTARPVDFPSQWSPGSSLDLWCKCFYYFFQYALSQRRIIINCGSRLLRVFEPLIDGAGAARFTSPRKLSNI